MANDDSTDLAGALPGKHEAPEVPDAASTSEKAASDGPVATAAEANEQTPGEAVAVSPHADAAGDQAADSLGAGTASTDGSIEPATGTGQANGGKGKRKKADLEAAMKTNSVNGPEPITSVKPDETVAETDGTPLTNGGPNTHDGRGAGAAPSAPAGLMVKDSVDGGPAAAQLDAPAPTAGRSQPAADPKVADAGVAMVTGSGARIIDADTGKPPSNLDGMFEPLSEKASAMVCQVRIVEEGAIVPGQSSTRRLLIPAGAHVSKAQAAQVVAAIRKQQES